MTRSPRTLILLDVDSVLVHPLGYKVAMAVLMDRIAAQMGQPPVGLSHDEIDLIEAHGLTCEWDSGAIFASMLLLAGLEQRPDLLRPTLDETLAALRRAGLALARPDFVGTARALGEAMARHDSGYHPVPSLFYLERLADRVAADYLPLLSALLGDVYSVETPITRTFQTFTLGHELFAQVYGEPAPFESESLLLRHDRPLLDADSRERLLDWLDGGRCGAAIYTARPTLPPNDLGDPVPRGYAPEGELAARLLDLDGRLPIIGSGRMGWLAEQRGRQVAAYLKPSPVQALAAIGAAATGAEQAALEAAATLAEDGALTDPLAALAGQPTRVIVFEDSPGGLRAAARAVERLQEAGLDVTFEGVGVSPQADKRAALVPVADRLVPDVNAGLAPVLALA